MAAIVRMASTVDFSGRLDRVQNSERDTGISDIRNVEKAVYYGDCLIQQKPAMDQPFGPAVQDEDDENEKERKAVGT